MVLLSICLLFFLINITILDTILLQYQQKRSVVLKQQYFGAYVAVCLQVTFQKSVCTNIPVMSLTHI